MINLIFGPLFAQSYEEQLELRQSQRDLQASIDKKTHGSSRGNNIPASPEGGGCTSSSDSSIDGKNNETATNNETGLENKSLQLSDSMKARAALEAISNFTSLTGVQEKLKTEQHSFDRDDVALDKKKQRVADKVPGREQSEVSDESMVKDWRVEWKSFVEEKKKNKYQEVAIQVCANRFLELLS